MPANQHSQGIEIRRDACEHHCGVLRRSASHAVAWSDPCGTSIKLVSGMRVRPANAGDVERIYRWANESEVRRWSLSQDQISWEDHQQWFSSVLADPTRVLFVGEMEEPVGAVRFDSVGDCTEVSIMLDSRFRGHRLSRRLLNTAMLAHGPATFTATVKIDNARSMSLFSDWTLLRVENGLAIFTSSSSEAMPSNNE